MAVIDTSTWSQEDVARFWRLVGRSDDGCWLWLGAVNAARGGYGVFSRQRKSYRAHRVALALASGGMLKDMSLHSCDNPRCCNPDHLREGDHAENMKDREIRNRQPIPAGSRNPNCRLSDSTIAAIRASELSGSKLAAIYGISRNYANAVKRGAYRA